MNIAYSSLPEDMQTAWGKNVKAAVWANKNIYLSVLSVRLGVNWPTLLGIQQQA